MNMLHSPLFNRSHRKIKGDVVAADDLTVETDLTVSSAGSGRFFGEQQQQHDGSGFIDLQYVETTTTVSSSVMEEALCLFVATPERFETKRWFHELQVEFHKPDAPKRRVRFSEDYGNHYYPARQQPNNNNNNNSDDELLSWYTSIEISRFRKEIKQTQRAIPEEVREELAKAYHLCGSSSSTAKKTDDDEKEDPQELLFQIYSKYDEVLWVGLESLELFLPDHHDVDDNSLRVNTILNRSQKRFEEKIFSSSSVLPNMELILAETSQTMSLPSRHWAQVVAATQARALLGISSS